MLDAGENSSSSSPAVSGECLRTSSSSTSLISKRKKSNNKRRFSDDQVRLLESMFETETKLEPRKKLQLARELGLQPRQVAIWFQNKRARWKSKQLERDYNLLSSNYNNLSSQFESLKKEKQSLLVQLRKLNDLIGTSEKEGRDYCCRREASDAEAAEDSICRRVSINNDRGKIEGAQSDVKPSLSLERSEYGVAGHVLSDDESSRNPDYMGLGKEPAELLNIMEPAGSSLTSPEEWGCLDSDVLLDKPNSSCYQWWDFWS